MEALDACYVQWGVLEVYSTPPEYIVRMTVTIDGRPRAYFGGFFQTAMTVPPEMLPGGFQVACGHSGAGGTADLGYQYSYVVRAEETGGAHTSNSGTVICPADFRLIFLDGFESGGTSRWSLTSP